MIYTVLIYTGWLENAQHKEEIFPEGQQQMTIIKGWLQRCQHKHLNLQLLMWDMVAAEILSIMQKIFFKEI